MVEISGKRRRKSTITDVAQECGVSVATVSNVLRGKPGSFSETTARQVMAKVEELGYVRNATASALSSRESHMIAVVVIGVYEPSNSNPDPEINPFYGEFIFRLDHEARQRGYTVCLYTGGEDDCVRFLQERQADAAVLIGVSRTDLHLRLADEDVAIIVFDSFLSNEELMAVRTDETRGGAIAAEHLISIGRKNLAFVGDVREDFPNNIPGCRLEGTKQACAKAGIPLEVIKSWVSFSSGRDTAKTVIERKFDGIVTAADVIAAGLIHGLQEENKRIPEDVAVVGYDNLAIARMGKPEITTVDQGLNDKVRAVLDLVIDGRRGETRVIEPSLVIRESA